MHPHFRICSCHLLLAMFADGRGYTNATSVITVDLQLADNDSRVLGDGTPQPNRTWAYFEYPAVAALMTSVLQYGIQYGLQVPFPILILRNRFDILCTTRAHEFFMRHDISLLITCDHSSRLSLLILSPSFPQTSLTALVVFMSSILLIASLSFRRLSTFHHHNPFLSPQSQCIHSLH